MYLPRRLRDRATASGAVFVGGLALLSVVMSAAAYSWIGVGIAVVVIVLLALAEFWREAYRLEGEKSDLEDELDVAQLEAAAAPGLRVDIQILTAENESLR